jgi:hypothetical protein
MKKKYADAWIAALRSGEYKQGKGNLRDMDNKFCCLGVLCDIVKDEIGLEWRVVDTSIYSIGHELNVLPIAVQDRLDMKTAGGRFSHSLNNPHVMVHGMYPAVDLWQLNDAAGYSFEQIADVIEKTWEDL